MTKIIVVDDEETSRRVVAKILEGMGATPILASNGTLALNIVRDNPDVALVVTDYMMEDFSGRDLVNELRNHETSHIPVILISGIVKLSEIHDLISNGVDRFMPKPINAEELRLYVRQLLGSKTAARA